MVCDLNLILREPDLVDYLKRRAWKKEFKERILDRAQEYTGSSRLLDLNVELDEEDDPETIILQAKFKGRYGKIYTTRVFLDCLDSRSEGGKIWEPDGDCSCPVGFNCKHAAAALLSVSSQLDAHVGNTFPVIDRETQRWLRELKMSQEAQRKDSSSDSPQKVQKPASQQFLAYSLVISENAPLSPPRFNIFLGRHLKACDLIDTYTNPYPNLSKPPKYMDESDIYPCFLYQQIGESLYYDGLGRRLRGKLGAKLLQAALETERLFVVTKLDSRHPTNFVTLGDPIEPKLDWFTHSDGSVSPVLNLPHSAVLIPTEPPYAFSLKTSQLYPVNTDSVSLDMMLQWESGPTLSPLQIPEVLPDLVRVKLPKPVSLEVKKLPPSAPAPHLKIYRKNPFTHAGLHLSGQPEPIIGELSFTYHGERFVPDLEDKPPEKASFTVYSEKTLLEIPRDTQKEIEYIFTLVDEWSLVPSYVHDGNHVAPDHASSFLPSVSPKVWDMGWVNFIALGIPQLKEEGWSFEIQESVDVEVVDVDSNDLETGLDELPDHGIDWFQFQASYLTPSGEKRSLLPILSQIIERFDLERIDEQLEGVDESEKQIFRDPETGDFISLSIVRLFKLAKNVRDLFGQESLDEPIHKIQAAGIADSMEMDSSKTLRALAELGNALKNITTLPKPKVPTSVNAELRDYQLDGFYWLQFLARHSLHGILADDMGLGKTLQTLTHIQAEVSSRRNKKRPSLVIAPTSVVGNWQAEAKKFCPKLKVLFLHGTERKSKFDQIDSHQLVLTTYGLLVRDFEILAQHEFHVLALDEAQYIKNPISKASQCACKLNAQHRISLSGTPIENHLGELWSQMRFLMPGLLGNQKQFREFFRTPIEKHQDSDAQEALNRRIAPLILRRTKDEVATELPEKTHILHTIPLNKQQIDIYETVRAAMDERVRDAISSKGLAKSQIIVLDALLKLRQICCHPQLLKLPAAKEIKQSAKLDFLTQDLLPTLLEEGRKILLFSTFTSMLKIIEDHLKKQKIPYAKITGQTRKRQQQIEKFQDGDAKVFLISLKAGGTGLNLTAADTVIHYDPWWNPAAENQATDRAHRIGQTKPVFVHKLIMEGTIEQRIQELQDQKSALVDALLTTDTNKLKMDKETLSNLLAPIDLQ